MRNREKIIIFLILLLGISLRVFDLGSKSLDDEEQWSVLLVQDGPSEIIKGLKEDLHPPLFFFILHYWLKVGQSDFFLRLLPAFFGVLAIFFTFRLGASLFSRRLGLIGCILVSMSPFVVLYDRLVRHYSLLTLLAIISCYLFARLKENRNKHWVLFIVISILGIYVHYYMFLIIVAQNILFVLRPDERKLWKRWIASHIIILLSFLPWLPIFLSQLLAQRETLNLVFLGRALKILYYFFAFSVGETILPFNFKVVIPAAIIFSILFVAGTIDSFFKKEKGLTLIGLFFLPFIFASFRIVTLPKHIILIYPLFCLIVAKGFLRLNSNILKIVAVSGVLFVNSSSFFNYYTNRQFHYTERVAPWKEIARDIERQTSGDYAVLIYPETAATHFSYYYKKNADKFIIPLNSPLEEAKKIVDRLDSYKNIWAVFHYGSLSNELRDEMKDYLDNKFLRVDESRYVLDEHLESYFNRKDTSVPERYYLIEVYKYNTD